MCITFVCLWLSSKFPFASRLSKSETDGSACAAFVPFLCESDRPFWDLIHAKFRCENARRNGRKRVYWEEKLGGKFHTFFVKIGFHPFKPMDNIENRAKKKSKGKVNLNIRNLIPFFETPTRRRAKECGWIDKMEKSSHKHQFWQKREHFRDWICLSKIHDTFCYHSNKFGQIDKMENGSKKQQFWKTGGEKKKTPLSKSDTILKIYTCTLQPFKRMQLDRLI